MRMTQDQTGIAIVTEGIKRASRARLWAAAIAAVVAAVSISKAHAIVNGEDSAGGHPGVFSICRERLATDPSPNSKQPLCGTAMQFGRSCVLTSAQLVWHQHGPIVRDLSKTVRLWHGKFSKFDPTTSTHVFNRKASGALLMDGRELVGGRPFGYLDDGEVHYADGLPEVAILRVGKAGTKPKALFTFPRNRLYRHRPIGTSPKLLDRVSIYGYGDGWFTPTKPDPTRAVGTFEVTAAALPSSLTGESTPAGFLVGDTSNGATVKPFPAMLGLTAGDIGGGVVANGRLIGITSFVFDYKTSPTILNGKPVDIAGWGGISNLAYLVYQHLSPNRSAIPGERKRMRLLRENVLAACRMRESELPHYTSVEEANLQLPADVQLCIDRTLQGPACTNGLYECDVLIAACNGIDIDASDDLGELLDDSE